MVRVGVDGRIQEEFLVDFPKDVEIVRIPEGISEPIEIDFWIPPFARKNSQDTFRMLRGVKVVQSILAGVDWILPWLPKDITLCDGQGVHDVMVSEWVLAAILTSLKRFYVYRDQQHRKEWRGAGEPGDTVLHVGEQYQVLGDDLAGKTVLIVGYGSIGKAIEARLKPFEVNVLRIARTARTEPEVSTVGDLHRLLPDADIVVVIVPMTPKTKGMIGIQEIALMKRGALLVNAARGPVVVTEVLVEALEESRIFAALDVTDPEPPPQGHPLWNAPHCIITPHVASSTPALLHRAYRLAADQVRRFAGGEPLQNVVAEDGY
ncbi:2-hydroxyacid dehydrogenase [Granulicella sibirica]|uniref:D-3-phosphoglycerate dehydrogenase n=1 Tax=Granulicella sibirica TaxID=2479048 RepID=A0A4Q0SY16_9BACT|nr:2-hydroxyacid dehydrogenase [Granulicella sibirica]RXH54508.1 D-3-phosphoglycerate dehydrogenase [Granulicella sibirica]